MAEDEVPMTEADYYEDYIIDFGTKHKGKTLTYVLKRDPDYIDWCRKNMKSFDSKIARFYIGKLQFYLSME